MFRVGQKVYLKPVDKCQDFSRYCILECMEKYFGMVVTISQVDPIGYGKTYNIEEDGGRYFYDESWFIKRWRKAPGFIHGDISHPSAIIEYSSAL